MNKTPSLKKALGKSFAMTALILFAAPVVGILFSVFAIAINKGYDEVYLTLYLSVAVFAFSAILLGITCALGAISFTNRKIQYTSFTVGWWILVLGCVVELLIQGVLITLLSYSITAALFNSYVPKLIALVGFAALAGFAGAVWSMFKRIPRDSVIDGELITRQTAPDLWRRVDNIAQKMNTQAPDHIIAGIETNFFVTEAPFIHKDKPLKGRTLYISTPLLRILSAEEADAILAHELNHLRGGDTQNSAALGPKLHRSGLYIQSMFEGGFTRIIYYPLNLYRLIFEAALQRESRNREFMADAAAAKTVSSKGIVHSLIKISAYAGYRYEVEEKLFGQEQRHDKSLGIADQVTQGLNAYAYTNNFLESMEKSNIPHPFDSHPSLADRMGNVNYTVNPSDYAAIVTEVPSFSWMSDIPNSEEFEKRQWENYEEEFAEDHEEMLAYRLTPSTPDEIAIVEKHFPKKIFNLKNDTVISVSYRGIESSSAGPITWDNVQSMNYVDGHFSDNLIITTYEKWRLGHKKITIKLPGIKKQRDEFQTAIGMQHQRHQIMLEMRKEK